MTAKLHQMNISYVAKEDRLLMRISTNKTQEYRLWLTRRYSGLLSGVLSDEIDKHGGEHSLAASDETRKMFKQGALEKAYEEDNVEFPLGKEGILAFRISAGLSEEGELQLEMAPEKGQGISLSLSKTLLYMFKNILQQGIDRAGWNMFNKNTASNKIH